MTLKQRKEVIAALRAAGRTDLAKHVTADKFDDAWGIVGQHIAAAKKALQDVQRNAPGFVRRDVVRDVKAIEKYMGMVDRLVKDWTEEG